MPHSSPFPSEEIREETFQEKLLNAIREHIAKDPAKIAAIDAHNESRRLSYVDLLEQSRRFQAFLQSIGMKQGDILTYNINNCIECLVVFLGTWLAGGAVSGASATFTSYELERQLSDSRSTFILCDSAHLKNVLEAKEKCDFVKTIICIRDEDSAPLPEGVIDFADALKCQPAAEDDYAKPCPRSMACLPYSSGTTGRPKGVIHSHIAIGTSAALYKRFFELSFGQVLDGENFSWKSEHFVFNMPVTHVFTARTLNTSLLSGSTAVIMARFEPKLYLATIQKYRIRVLYMSPVLLTWLLKDATPDCYDISSVKILAVAGAPASTAVCDHVHARFPTLRLIASVYGLTEVLGGTNISDITMDKPYKSVGPPIPNFECKVIDMETDDELPDGLVGEICIRGPTLMTGYLNRPAETAAIIDSDGWLHTSDCGFSDSVGRLTLVGRNKELIKVRVNAAASNQVSPSEIEDVLLSHPQVRDAAVVGIPDPDIEGLELIRAYIVREHEATSMIADLLHELVKEKLAEFKRISGGIFFIDELPKNPTGKILRNTLKEKSFGQTAIGDAAS